MIFKNLNVDNYVMASIIDASFKIKVKLIVTDSNTQENQYFFLPTGMVKENIAQYPLDTFGILNKTKLLMREPITGDQISYIHNKAQFENVDESNGINITTTTSKSFYFYEIKNTPHKYQNSIFTNLKSKNINIIFPNSETIHVISDEISNLKKYVKKISNKIANISSITEIIIPKEMSINENGKIINYININNNTYLGMTYQISQILKILFKDIKSNIKASQNDNNYINKIFFVFYNFIPNFITPLLFKFLLRLNKSNKFSNQVLEIDNFYNFENYFFNTPIDEEFSKMRLSKGKFIPKITIKEKNKDIKDLFSSEINIICSSNLNIKTKNNVIYLKTSLNKNQSGYIISQSSFEYLNLEKCYYEVSSSGLILMVDLNDNINKRSESSSSKSKYYDLKQESLDSFDTNNFKPSLPKLPKLKFNFNWPLKSKKQ
tara:strand:- start:605 stop:1906 length:1302 start_codon:yes stop_codon:yes gene_type:complete